MLVEEEDVLDDHQAALHWTKSVRAFSIEVPKSTHRFANDREESVQNSRCQVRIEARRGRAPSRRAQRHGREEEKDRQSAKVGGQQHGEQSPASQADEISDQRMLDGILRLHPLPKLHQPVYPKLRSSAPRTQPVEAA